MKLKMVRLLPLTLHSLTLASGLSPTPNRCISDFANVPSKFLASLGTSYVRRTLSEMPAIALMEDDKDVEYNSI